MLTTCRYGASFWSGSLTWRTFFCSVIAAFTVNFLISGTMGKVHSHTRLYRERREREVMFFFFFTNQEKTEERVHTSDRTSRAGTR
jgi:hypothetical protein